MFGTAIPHTHERRYCPRLPDTAIDLSSAASRRTDSIPLPKHQIHTTSRSLFTVSNKNVKPTYTQHKYFQITDEDSEK